MQKIGNSTSTADSAGEFTEGNPAGGVAATQIKAAWLNSLQRELIALISGSGIVLDAKDDSQIYKAVLRLAKTAADFPNIGSKPTTLGGYGISDAYTRSQVDSLLSDKVTRSTTLAGYGITDAYTKLQVDSSLGAKANKATTLAGYGITDAAKLDGAEFTATPKVPDTAPLDWSQLAANTRFVRETFHGFTQIDLSGVGDYVLTDAQAAKAIIYFVGVLTGDRTVVLPKAFNRYVIRNATSGSYKLTVKMPVGVGVEVTQGMIASVLTDSSNTLPDQTDYSNIRLTGKSMASAPSADSNDGQISNTAWTRSLLASYGIGTDNMPDVTNTNLGTMFVGGAFFIGAGCTDLPPGVGSGYMYVLPNAGNEAVQTFYSGYREFRRASVAGVYPTWEETPRTSTVNASISAAVSNKADKSNSLAGYGILAATQQEAEQGSDTTKPMTALRVWQAIAAKVVAATEFIAGISRFASLAEVKAGAAGYIAVCPSYLLDGFGYNFGVNGYLKLPSWMGGLIIQWAYSDESLGSGDFRYFPVPFTQVVYGSWIQLSVETSTGFAGNFGTIISIPDLTRYQWTAAGSWGGGGKGWILALGK